jgi:hypothetical protein
MKTRGLSSVEKITNIIDQLEKKLSKLILLIWTVISYPFIKTHSILQPLARKLSEFFQNMVRGIIQSVIAFVQILNSMVGPRAWNFYKHKMQNFMQKVQEEKAEKIKLLKKSNPSLAKKPKGFFSDIGLLFDAFVESLSKISPLKFATMGFLFLILLINSFHFLSSSSDLVTTIKEENSANLRRAIASTVDDIPSYYNDLARLSSIKGLKIPAYTSNINKIKSLEVDTQILFYNRAGKQFFDESQIIFLDHLEMTLEPIQPSFPLSPEGKMVIKEKIKNEINSVLRQEGIKSHVENVFFTNIFAN